MYTMIKDRFRKGVVMKLRMIIVSLILLVMVGCGMLPEEEGALVPPIITPEEIPYRTIVMEKQDIIDDVTVRGAVAPAIMENYFFNERGGRVASINVRVGDFVEEGDILIQLVVDQLPETIAYQELTVSNLQIDYDSTVAIQKLELRRSAEALAEKEADYEEMLAYTSLYTSKELTSAKTTRDEAALSHEILSLNQKKELALKANNLATEELRLTNYIETLEKSYIRSSMTGVVTFVKRMFIGDVVSDFDTLISVADVTQMQIDYQGAQAHEFELGMPVDLVYRGQSISGTVIQTPDSVPVEDKALYVNTAVFAFDQVPDNYIMGDDVDVKAVLNSRQGVIVLPKDAVKTFGQDKLVYVLEDGEKRERYISLGIDAGPYVEVMDGLNEGDEVIIN